jgi:hypothetical protein
MAKAEIKDAEKVEKSIVTQAFNTMPATVQEAIKLSELIAGSDLAPKNFKDKPGNCYIAIQMGAEVGLSPMQAIQNICVINGRPTIYGDMGKALLLAKGCRIEERDIKEIRASGEAWCRITRADGKRQAIRTFSMENAEHAKLLKKEGPWQTDPYRMLAWRAFWFCARDVAADLLHGLGGVEEVRDYVDTTVVPPIAMPKSTKEKEQVDTTPADIAETREMIFKAFEAITVERAEIADYVARHPELETEEQVVEHLQDILKDIEQSKTTVDAVFAKEATDPAGSTKQANGGGKAALPPFPSNLRQMTSKRESKCQTCGKEILVGQEIGYDGKIGRAHHRSHFS